MRVNVEYKELQEKHGLIRRTTTTYYQATCLVDLNEEERAIIKQRNLGDHVFFEQALSASRIDETQASPRARSVSPQRPREGARQPPPPRPKEQAP